MEGRLFRYMQLFTFAVACLLSSAYYLSMITRVCDAHAAGVLLEWLRLWAAPILSGVGFIWVIACVISLCAELGGGE